MARRKESVRCGRRFRQRHAPRAPVPSSISSSSSTVSRLGFGSVVGWLHLIQARDAPFPSLASNRTTVPRVLRSRRRRITRSPGLSRRITRRAGTSVPVPVARACQGAAALLARRGGLALPLDRRLLVVGAPLHLLKRALFQHELLQLFERGVHLVVDDVDARHQSIRLANVGRMPSIPALAACARAAFRGRYPPPLRGADALKISTRGARPSS